MESSRPVRIVSIMWSSYVPAFLAAARQSPHVSVTLFSIKEIQENSSVLDRFWAAARTCDAVLLFWTNDGFWDEVAAGIGDIQGGRVIVTTSFDPTHWGRCATLDMDDCAQAYAYLAQGGEENYRRLLHFIASHVKRHIPVEPPVPLPWQGIMSPPDAAIYDSTESYLKAHPPRYEETVGILFSRNSFVNTDGALESAIIQALEHQGLNVLPVFSHYTPDAGLGAEGPLAAAEHFFLQDDGRPRIKALINLQFSFLGRRNGSGFSDTSVARESVEFFRKLNVPVFKPVISYAQSAAQWEENPQGLVSEVTFGIVLPEFEGNIEPVLIGCSRKEEDAATGTVFEIREVLTRRVERMAGRIARWVRLARKPPQERKVVFVVHKNECAGLEANIGGAGGLDAGESIVEIMRAMQVAGYRVGSIPPSGEALMQTFLARKAIAEFRWTTVDEIISKGGHLALLPSDVYREWFEALTPKAKRKLVEAWGEPPGQELNGVPPSMVFDGRLVITGLNFGNVNVIMQPKRGCAGARCDGQVCKILHDPDVPPPHQYIATYMYMDKVFGADVIIHVGTHGNLEWMPGKGAGLSDSCWPDIALGALPNLYIYNADNPAEGVVAKRRSNAVLVDHMQAVMTTADTYGDLAELEELLDEYERARKQDPARAHQVEHLIGDALERCHLKDEVEKTVQGDFPSRVVRCHEILSRIRNSQTYTGMHIFGRIPQGESRAEMINTILRFDSGNELNARRLVFDVWREELEAALRAPADRGRCGRVYGELLFEADRKAKDFIAALIDGKDVSDAAQTAFQTVPDKGMEERLKRFAGLVSEIDRRISHSQEIDSLLNGMSGGHIPAGPSGYISRGRYDILPTGRNFYNVDPTRIPTRAAYRVGVRLGEALLDRFMREEGRHPEQVGMVWLASDIMRADGEQMGQILHLLGAHPRWKPNGQVDGFELIPTAELGRPRIDVHIRVSGISRDCFPDALKYLDSVVQAAAMADEPPEENFVRKHLLDLARGEKVDIGDPEQFRRLSYRIFCAQPGVYRAGVNLAVYASAWKTEKDLSDIYVFWNGYAYGGGAGEATYGVPAHRELVGSLRRVEVTFDKHISDETDFLSCCGFFGNYGGMTAAAHTLSGRKPKTYYGDTRDPANVEITDFADEMRRVVRAKLLNPKYIEGMKAHGYKGAGDLSKRIGRVYGFAATTGEVDGWIFDEIAETFVLDEAMRRWFQEVNPWALEEVGRRLLEAQARSIWQPDEELLDRLKDAYLELEGTLEDTLADVTGEFQGGAVDVMTAEDVAHWREQMGKILGQLDDAS
ncbi:cobaltochelatase subunit CobN [Desulforhabdus amnigena]|uniref:Cobaltochelatase subunit CobN n=1 Tax=Desulforhabdus amnigena TaxID=40218 RepID=A0A9W6FV83_9BACT|nr:cobaltochelatase subunit CobN [Desulforhabdus amnigena]NLJ28129.1 cobaltochelatase subunit CobN [Deltaproteobacteria bacterium]GLI35479.1 cobaltochelatase subunit CobN [Desulforhabdus amnigena]